MKNLKLYVIAALAALCAGFPFCQFAETVKPADFTDSPPVFDQKGEGKLWTTNGVNGICLDCYCKIGPVVPESAWSTLQRCRLTFSTNGVLTSAELLPERVRITASCNIWNKVPRPGQGAAPGTNDTSRIPPAH